MGAERNHSVRKEVVVHDAAVKVHYQRKWLRHFERMDTNRVHGLTLQYRANGRGNVGRLRKIWKEG